MQQPPSLQWLQNWPTGATGTTLTAGTVGNYSCQSTATNHAGIATQIKHSSVPVFKLGKVKLDKKKGPATLSVQVGAPEP